MKKILIIAASILSLISMTRPASAGSPQTPPTVGWHEDTSRGELPGSNRVSGTDIVVRPEFHSGSSPLVSAQLFIGGTSVRDWTFDPTISGTYIAAPTMWASTVFTHGTPVTIKAECKDENGKTGSASFSVTPYNRAYVLGNTGSLNFGDDAVAVVEPHLAGMDHDVTSSTTDDKATILSNIPDFTVFYSWTHGTPTELLDTGANIAGNYIADSDVSSAVSTKTDQPAYNFVFLDACKTGQTTTLNGAFGADTYLGWSESAPDSQAYVDWTGRVFGNLENSETVWQAVWKAGPTEKYNIGNGRGVIMETPDEGEPTPVLFPIVIGNRGMTLFGVYGNTSGEWYRELTTT